MNNIKLSQAKAMKQLYALTTKRTIDLSLSENPLGCSPLVLAASKNLKVNFNDSFFRISVRTHDINLRFIQKISSSSYGSKLKEPR